MLRPKRTLHRKYRKGTIHGLSVRSLARGTYGLRAREPARLTARQLEAARRSRRRHMSRRGRIWRRLFPDYPVTAKPNEVRMGKGKGAVEYWTARARQGDIIFERDGIPAPMARRALRAASRKRPRSTATLARPLPLQAEEL